MTPDSSGEGAPAKADRAKGLFLSNVDPEIRKRVKIACLHEETNMRTWVLGLIEDYLNEKGY